MTIQDPTTPTAPAPSAARTARAGRWPATAVFLLNGLTLSTYIVRLPALKDEHHLTDGQVGTIGALFAVAALASMQFVGPLVARFGSRTMLRVSLAAMPLLLGAVGLAGGPVAFAVAVTALGAVHGATDAAMNAHAVTVERLAGRPVLNGCHAAWSVSAVAASLAAAVSAHTGVGSATHLGVAAAVLLAGGLAVGPLLLPAAADRRTRPSPKSGRAGLRGAWTGKVVALGLTGTVLMVCEGAALGWGAIFLHEGRGVSLGLATAAVTAYTAGQTGGRLIGDRLTARHGATLVFRAGGLVAACGLTAAVLVPYPPAAVAGFAVAGLGGSVLVPLVVSAVARNDGTGHDAATLVSRLTTFTYAGVLLGPALIGSAAEAIGLAGTLAALIPLLLTVALFGPIRRGNDHSAR
ncbi:MFS transporter [Actinoallomurus rhizosphaericola]|uniref:MFS transporter n=1 Tax=Actinoallomurus rhizosphaericola TaxID=2952536 RepID=UPI0020916FCD|nr:MFS transporter [Actinoallomurus rhizosphaericola]MCO5994283.1 MFS transporter [Actinoallomurus rhizosphaericola]